MANNTRSALSANSLFGTSCSLPSLNSTRLATSVLTFPSSPLNALVCTDQSRSHPSSCEDEVRSFIGQYGHTNGLFSCSGGCGSNSNCVTDNAPCRFEVPTQTDPV